MGRKQKRGPQHQVKPASSTELQSGSRAEHTAAKATSDASTSGSALDLGGVRGAARAEGLVRNRRDPSYPPSSRHGSAYKPKAKSQRGKRESEGAVVPAMAVHENAAGGKGPYSGQASTEVAGEGMAQTAASNHPEGRELLDKVRRLQRKLYGVAKQQKERRFHALYDRIHRSDVLWEAWRRVRSNRGAGGVDGVTLAAVEEYGIEKLVTELQEALQAGKYRPPPVLRRYIPKPDGRQRPLGIPTVKDRVAQAAAKLILEPIFEADFLPCSYGFRPRRSATEALETIREKANTGCNHVLDADIRDYFGSISQELLLERVRQRVSDRRVLKLLRSWLGAGVMDEGRYQETVSGVPQGGVISPLLSNIYLHFLDSVWQERLKLELHPEKTQRVELSYGKEGFDFLGCHLHKRLSGRLFEKTGRRVHFLQRWPSRRSMKRVRTRIHELTTRKTLGAKDVRVVIGTLNPMLRGWGNYFRTGNAADKFNQLDTYTYWRLKRWMVQRRGRNLRAGQVKTWTPQWFWGLGLHRMLGTIRYPKQCALPVKTPVKPYAGKPHVRFERRRVETGRV